MSVSELATVARIDLRQRWRRGEQPAAGDYLARFPQLQAEPELVVDLIYSEFLVREELGQRPQLGELQQQYPQYAEELTAQIGLHRALGDSEKQPGATAETQQPEQTLGQHQKPSNRLPSLGPGYEVLAEIGHGGMGVVYRARQIGLNRLVALKMVRGAEYASSEVLARFRAEAEVVARLHHPQIVQIYDYGEHDGMPYLALELVEGGTLAARLDGTPWPARKAAGLIQTLAQAVEFAHHRGVIHRDLKPANVLLCTDGNGVKIADFGLAKAFRENSSGQTQSGALLGTPSYMAPEQAAGRAQQIGPAADVYALGAILYELLTGRPPFRGETPIETLQQVLTSEPVSISLIAPRMPRDLATICSKCLSREVARRYFSAAELADDIARFLADQPIRARPTSRAEHAWRWCRRNPALAGALGAVAVLLFCVATISTWYSTQLRAQLNKTQQAEKAERESNQTARLRLWDAYLAEIDAGRGSQRLGARTTALATIERANELLNTIGRTPERVLKLRNAAIATLAKPDLREERIVAITPGVTRLSFSVAADRYAGAGNNEATVHKLSTGELLHKIPRDPTVMANSIFPGISVDGRFVSIVSNRDVKIWRCEGDRPELIGQWEGASRPTFSPDSKQVIVCDPAKGLSLIDLESSTAIWNLAQREVTTDAAFHEASRRIAVCTKSGVCIIDSDTGAIVAELPEETAGGYGIAWHPGGEAVAVCGLAEGIALWNVVQRRRLTWFRQPGYVICPHFSRDGNFLLAYEDWSGELQVWNTGTGQAVVRSTSIDRLTADVSGSPGDYLIQMRPDCQALLRIVPGLVANPLLDAPHDSLGDVYGITISPDGRLLAIGRTRGFDVWDLVTHRRVSHAGSPYSAPAFKPDGDLLVACRWGLCCWPRQSLAGEIRLGPPQILSEPLADTMLGLSSDGRVAAILARSGWQLVHLQANKRVVRVPWEKDARGAAVSPDGAWLSLANWHEAGVNIWDAASGQHVASLAAGITGRPLFSPDGRWLATTPDGVRLWRTGDWKPGSALHAQGTTPGGLGITFSPDSRVLAVGQPDEITRLVGPETGQCYAELLRPDSRNSAYLAFTPDQSQLIEVPSGDRGAPRIWDLFEIRRELAIRGLDWPADVLGPNPTTDSSSIATELIVKLDDGGLLVRQQSLDILRQAASAAPARKMELYHQALGVDPTYAAAHNNLAWLLATGPSELRSAAESLTHARRALELDTDNATYLNTLGVALCRTGEFDESIAKLQRSLDLSRDQSGAYDLVFLALAHAGKGNAETARDYYAQATTWFEAHRQHLPTNWREELSRLLQEARSEVFR